MSAQVGVEYSWGESEKELRKVEMEVKQMHPEWHQALIRYLWKEGYFVELEW